MSKARPVKVRPYDETERTIYALTFVVERERLISLGVHEQFRIDFEDTGERVREWESWCADLGLDAARSAVKAHRNALRRAKERA